MGIVVMLLAVMLTGYLCTCDVAGVPCAGEPSRRRCCDGLCRQDPLVRGVLGAAGVGVGDHGDSGLEGASWTARIVVT